MERRGQEARRVRRLKLSRETLLDLAGDEQHTEAVRGGTGGIPKVTDQPSYCYVCHEDVPPTKQTYPVTGDACAQATPKKNARYRTTHTVETEVEYKLLDFEETPGGGRTDSFIIESSRTRVVDTETEELPENE